MAPTDNRNSPMGLAFEWVARIMAVSLLMIAPVILGQRLDQRFGTSFLALVGMVFGMVAGIGCLLLMTKSIGKKNAPGSKPHDNNAAERHQAEEQDSDHE